MPADPPAAREFHTWSLRGAIVAGKDPNRDPLQGWCPDCSPYLIAAAVMLPTFMEVLDTAIASVALPHIAGSLSATTDEATWVLTSYLVANAVVLPASSWFALRFGRRNFLVFCIVVFTVASFLCGAATSLGMILLARAVQGAGGGALQPLSQAILLESFPPAKRGPVWSRCGRRAGIGTHPGGMADRPIHLAVGFLYQRACRCAGGIHDFAFRKGPALH